jgi:hypothetical protein
MPLLKGKRNIGRNIAEMEAAGHPRVQSIAAALHTADIKRKDPPMAKMKASGHESGMAGEKGMSPRKAMASGLASGGGNFGVKSYGETHGGTGQHPDHAAHTGMKGVMADSERATPPGIHHTKGHLPAQAAPRHGPHHPGGHGDWDRGGTA